MRTAIAFFSLVVFTSLVTSFTFAQKAGDALPPSKYKEYTLKNGLHVVMHEDKSTPIVGVNLW
jgi:hypothetical protein